MRYLCGFKLSCHVLLMWRLEIAKHFPHLHWPIKHLFNKLWNNFSLVKTSRKLQYNSFNDGLFEKKLAFRGCTNIEYIVMVLSLCYNLSGESHTLAGGVIANDVMKMRKVIEFQSSWIVVYYKSHFRVLLQLICPVEGSVAIVTEK